MKWHLYSDYKKPDTVTGLWFVLFFKKWNVFLLDTCNGTATGRHFFLIFVRLFLCSPIHPFKRLIILNVTNWLTVNGHKYSSPSQVHVHGVKPECTYPPPFFWQLFYHTLLNIILVSNNHKSTISFSLYWFLYQFVPFYYQATGAVLAPKKEEPEKSPAAIFRCQFWKSGANLGAS
jgi:hypothetical protein